MGPRAPFCSVPNGGLETGQLYGRWGRESPVYFFDASHCRWRRTGRRGVVVAAGPGRLLGHAARTRDRVRAGVPGRGTDAARSRGPPSDGAARTDAVSARGRVRVLGDLSRRPAHAEDRRASRGARRPGVSRRVTGGADRAARRRSRPARGVLVSTGHERSWVAARARACGRRPGLDANRRRGGAWRPRGRDRWAFVGRAHPVGACALATP